MATSSAIDTTPLLFTERVQSTTNDLNLILQLTFRPVAGQATSRDIDEQRQLKWIDYSEIVDGRSSILDDVVSCKISEFFSVSFFLLPVICCVFCQCIWRITDKNPVLLKISLRSIGYHQVHTELCSALCCRCYVLSVFTFFHSTGSPSDKIIAIFLRKSDTMVFLLSSLR